MANYSPIKANQARREKGASVDLIKIVDKKTKETVLETTNLKQASRVLGAYELYVFHVKNGHRKARIHPKYDLYINGEKIVPKSDLLDKQAIVYKGLVAYPAFGRGFHERSRLEIVDIKEKENGIVDVWIKFNELPVKYFCFTPKNKPTYNNLVKKIKQNLINV